MKNKIAQAVYKSHLLTGKIRLQQNEFFLDNLENIILSISPHRIIEIGTARGGTTLAISDILIKNEMHDCKIKSFDITQRSHLIDLNISNVSFYIGNIFKYNSESLTHPNEITDFISEDNVNLFLCDGGHKVKEFITLCPYLRSGDVIMLHDYAPNKEIFESEYKDKIWNWMEVTDQDILPCIEKYNLSYYRMDLIKPSAWVSLVKQ